MKITLPFPDRKLSPNHHAHWRSKERARRGALKAGIMLTKLAEESQVFERSEAYKLVITFYPPDRRHRDADNLHAAMKHFLDGVCTALDINDRQFRQVQLGFGEVRKDGQVEIEITPLPAADGGVE